MTGMWRINKDHGLATPKGGGLVTCKILKPDGSLFRGTVFVSIYPPCNHHSGIVTTTFWGNATLPLPDLRLSGTEEQDFFFDLFSDKGFLTLKDPDVIKPGAKLKLMEGGFIRVNWRGQGLCPDFFSSENYSVPEISDGLTVSDKGVAATQTQRPPGLSVINATFSSDHIVRYKKLCMVEPGKTIHVEMGENIADYSIDCLLPESLSKDLKITLAVDRTVEFASPCFAKQKDMDDILKLAETGGDHFYFEDWPMKDNSFEFIADENHAHLNIVLECDGGKQILQTVKFVKGDPRNKTVDLRNNKILRSCSSP